ncbi:MAG: leishmanolysin-related zinc metalloendopeptidase [Paracoccaceae bacterium]
MTVYSTALREADQVLFEPLSDTFVFATVSLPADEPHPLRCPDTDAGQPVGAKAGLALTSDAGLSWAGLSGTAITNDADLTVPDDRDGDSAADPSTAADPTVTDTGDDRDGDSSPDPTQVDGDPGLDGNIDDRDGDGASGLLTEYTSGGDAATSYNITVVFEGTWIEELQQAFIAAADYLSQIILADLPDVSSGGVIYDDMTITATLVEIDGVNGTLGQAGPTWVRIPSYLPYQGIMEFDIADAETFNGYGLWDDIILHEMMHTLGFGTLWSYLGLTDGSIGGGDLTFNGTLANLYFVSEFGGTGQIPVEMDGGAGTAGGHWDDAYFVNELMTGYISNPNYISAMTIASLEDLGYDTVIDDPNDPSDLFGTIPADPINIAIA